MYEIIFYEDKNGYSEVKDYIQELEKKEVTNKNARIHRNRIIAYFRELKKMGTRVGEPISKHLDGEIWELRPLEDRFLYAYYKDNKFIVLHHFVKKTKKIPKRELLKAKRNLKDYMERKR